MNEALALLGGAADPYPPPEATLMDIAHPNDPDSAASQTLALDCLNLFYLANSSTPSSSSFSDVVFLVDGKHVHAHRCILAARSTFFRMVFSSSSSSPSPPERTTACPSNKHGQHSSHLGADDRCGLPLRVPVAVVRHDAFVAVLRFLYCGRLILEPLGGGGGGSMLGSLTAGGIDGRRSTLVDIALEVLHAANFFGIRQLSLVVQKHLGSMVGKLPVHDVMRVLVAASKKQLGHEHNRNLWETCSRAVAGSGLGRETLRRQLPLEVAAAIEDMRARSEKRRDGGASQRRYGAETEGGMKKRPWAGTRQGGVSSGGSMSSVEDEELDKQHGDDSVSDGGGGDGGDGMEEGAMARRRRRWRRMRQALEGMDVELVRMMVMGEGLQLDEAQALRYAVERRLGRAVVKALLEMGALDVDHPGPDGRTPLQLACEMADPDMVSLLLDHHASPLRTGRVGPSPSPSPSSSSSPSSPSSSSSSSSPAHVPRDLPSALEIVQSKLSNALSRDPSAHDDDDDDGGESTRKLRLCLELLQSAARVALCDAPIHANDDEDDDEVLELEEDDDDDDDDVDDDLVARPSELLHEASCPNLSRANAPAEAVGNTFPTCRVLHHLGTSALVTSASSVAPAAPPPVVATSSVTTPYRVHTYHNDPGHAMGTHLGPFPASGPWYSLDIGAPVPAASPIILDTTTIVTGPNGLLYPHVHTNPQYE